MSDIDDCREFVERLTRDREEVMRAGAGRQAMIREYIHDSCCPICNRAETTERVIREEEGCTKVSRVCTACGGEWRSSLDGDVIQNLRIKKLEAENERLTRHVRLLQDKIDAERSCACAYDDPNEVCLPHSPLLANALAENERLRGALEYIVNVCPAIDPDGDQAHERARKALEGKP